MNNRPLTILVLSVFISISTLNGQFDEGTDTPPAPGKVGMLPMTAEQHQQMHKKFPPSRHIRANNLALGRLNAEREKKGLPKIDEQSVDLAPAGQEAMGVPSTGGSTETLSSASLYPTTSDNSTLDAFPPIGNQSNNDCVAWASTYYWLTYETARARGWNAKTGGTQYRFSPRWTYGMINGGVDNGSYGNDAFNLLMKHGAANLVEFPYSGTHYRAWCLNPDAWRNAMKYRITSIGTVIPNSTSGLDQLKQQIANGHVLFTGTFFNSMVKTTVKNNPSTTADDGFVSQVICSYMKNTRLGGHAMTIVGYNDDLWCDVNLNGLVDSGELGAVKVANSHGTSYANAGFIWVAYDALFPTSQVVGGPTDREAIFASNGYAYWATVNPTYSPKLVGVFTVTHAKRNQLLMKLGMAGTTSTTPASVLQPSAIRNQGGAYSFNGTTNTVSGTFALDFTDLNPTVGVTKRYFLGINDNTAGSPATLSSFNLTDASGNILADSVNDAQTADAQEKWSWVDHTLYGAPNALPLAVATATPTSGTAPLAVFLDGSGSYDSDGAIVSYAWNFGDGTTGTGATASHTYSFAGTYQAILTVTDNVGAARTATVSIIVSPGTDNVITASIADSSCSEPGTDTGSFRLSRTGDLTAAITVYYSMGGSATNGTDYQSLTGSAVIPAGSASTNVILAPINDTRSEPTESATLTVSQSANYLRGSTVSATISIVDNDQKGRGK